MKGSKSKMYADLLLIESIRTAHKLQNRSRDHSRLLLLMWAAATRQWRHLLRN
jgi:hypothetical protein